MGYTAESELERLTRVKVSTAARALPGFSYAAVSLGAGITSLFLYQAIRSAEMVPTDNVGAFLNAIGNMNFAVMAGLYIGAVLGFIGVAFTFARLMVNTATASPPGSLFLVPGILGFLPAFVLWTAQSQIIAAATPGGLEVGTDPNAVMANATNLLLLNIPLSVVGTIVSLLASLVPFEYRMLRTAWPLAFVTGFYALLIYAMFGFQYRTWWLFNVPY